MPATPETYRRAQSTLSARAVADLRKVWPRVSKVSADRLAGVLAPVLVEVTDKYGAAAAALAAEWFEDMRDAAGAAGSSSAVLAEPPSVERLEVLSRWGVGPMFGASPDAAGALSLLSGGLSRQVLDMGRDTVARSVAADTAGPRYARHASANACAFCAMLATRGPVYTSTANAGTVTGENLGGKDYRKMRATGMTRDQILAGTREKTIAQGGRKGRDTLQPLGEKYHDDCHCTAVPVWPGQRYEEAPYVEKWREAYADAPSNDTKDILASMREGLGTN